MNRLGVFVGSSVWEVTGDEVVCDLQTPWGRLERPPREIQVEGGRYLLLNRHGAAQELSPHAVNYRANVWLMRELGVTHLLGTHTVGAIDPDLDVGDLVLPHQLIDYTWGRESTFDDVRRHAIFEDPYSPRMRDAVMRAAPRLVTTGVYGCTQGPRLETAAEISRMARDGCTLVGMTGMPEAALACELEIAYASLCIVVNPAAGVSSAGIDGDAITAASHAGARALSEIVASLAAAIA